MSEGIETLLGSVNQVIFHNPDNGFSVLRVSLGKRKEGVTIVGHLPEVRKGERIEARGEWKQDRKHGLQFQAESIAIEVPTTRHGIERYLRSGMVRGIGRHLARLLVAEFGDRLFEVIEKTPRKLSRVPGIGAKRVEMISESWREQKSVRDLMVFLAGHGVGAARAYRIHKQYGNNAVGLIRENPYRLADDIRGIGFLSADSIATSLGVEANSPFRVDAGIRYVLNEMCTGNGHCGVPRETLVAESAQLLRVPEDSIVARSKVLVEQKRLVADSIEGAEGLFPVRLHRAERTVATALRRLTRKTIPWPSISAEKAIQWFEKKSGMKLSESQNIAIQTVLGSPVAVITGGPGVGKTTILDAVIRILSVKGVQIELGAPTGRAAKRLSETTSRPARTIHRLLEVNARTGEFARNEDTPIKCDLLIIDESSMVDINLMEAVVRALPKHAGLLLVGDVDQLPSIGPGRVLGDVIDSATVPVVRLTEIFRQAAESRIVVNAHRINEGKLPALERRRSSQATDFYFVEVSSPERAVERIIQMVDDRIPARFGLDPFRDIQVLAPMKRGAAGVQALNVDLQFVLNHRGIGSEQKIERFGSTFAAGDKVIQLENDYEKEVFNGDLGRIELVDPEQKSLVVDFEGGSVEYPVEDVDQLALGYAITIHKSQGSEYPAVVVPILNQHYVMLQRNLLYTAVTRGKKLVVIVGQRKAIARAVRNVRISHRWTKLGEWLRER
ncbi:MAG: ATP-dependent RecD-like DNA helicase [Acidobacteriota bacterium]